MHGCENFHPTAACGLALAASHAIAEDTASAKPQAASVHHGVRYADFLSGKSGMPSPAIMAVTMARMSARTRHSAILLPNGLSHLLNSRIMLTAVVDMRLTFLQSSSTRRFGLLR